MRFDVTGRWQAEPMSPTAIDLFCGAGGASLGLVRAGWDLRLASDIDLACSRTHQANLPGRFLTEDLRNVGRGQGSERGWPVGWRVGPAVRRTPLPGGFLLPNCTIPPWQLDGFVTTAEAIGDLPPVAAGEEVDHYVGPPMGPYQKAM